MEEEKINYSLGKKQDFEIESIIHNDIGGATIKTWKPQEIETHIVQASMKETDFKENLNKPFLFIIFPFFAPKKKRNINIIYAYDDIGLEFLAEIKGKNHLENLNNQQPSDFERNIFEFILHKFQTIAGELSNEIKPIVKNILNDEGLFDMNDKKTRIRRKEVMLSLLREKNLENKKVDFNIEDIISYLGLKSSPKYYTRIEEALYNLQSTTYSFKISNKRKVKGIIRQEIYSEPLNLIKYYKVREKDEGGRWRVFYQVTLSRNIFEELVIKSYSIFDKDNLLKIRKENQPSEKIFQYICMKRYNNEHEFSIETISTIAGFSLIGTIKKQLKDGTEKEFKVKQISKVKKKLEFSYQKLVDMGYLSNFEIIEKDKSLIFKHAFNDESLICHRTDFINIIPSSDEIMKEELILEFEESNKEEQLEDEFEKSLKKLRKNIYFEKKYTVSVRKRLINIYNKFGAKIFNELANKIYKGLNQEIKKSIYSYLKVVLEETISTEKNKNKSLFDLSKNDENKIKKEKIIEKENKIEIEEGIYITMYNSLPEAAKQEVDKVAYEFYLKDINKKELNNIDKRIYESIKNTYVIKVLKGGN